MGLEGERSDHLEAINEKPLGCPAEANALFHLPFMAGHVPIQKPSAPVAADGPPHTLGDLGDSALQLLLMTGKSNQATIQGVEPMLETPLRRLSQVSIWATQGKSFTLSSPPSGPALDLGMAEHSTPCLCLVW